MAGHSVFIQLSELELTSADTSFLIKADNQLIGTIHISQGAFEYQPTGWMKKNSIKLSWQKLDKMLRELGNK